MLIAHGISTLLMVAILWFVQIVRYPAFLKQSREGFKAFHTKHMGQAGAIIAPLMLLEVLTGLWLCFQTPWGEKPLMLASVSLLLPIWISTFLVLVPLHNKLSADYDRANIQKLITSNWIRTILWTLRGGLLVLCFTYGA